MLTINNQLSELSNRNNAIETTRIIIFGECHFGNIWKIADKLFNCVCAMNTKLLNGFYISFKTI